MKNKPQISLPATMSHIVVSGAGGPECLSVGEGPVPAPGEGEVLVRVAAAGVNRPDILQRQGYYPPPPGASAILGLDIAGTVVAASEGVTRWLPGTSVCALVAGGGYAQYCVAPAAQCLPVPAGFSMVEAAALPECFFTVWTNVFERGRLAPGETLLVHGGTSGIGTTAIELARDLGARVITTSGSDEKCAACVRLGAELAINYRTQDFVAEVKKHTNNHGVDVILDIIGGEYVARNLDILAVDGRLVCIAHQLGSQAEIDLRPIIRKRLTLTGSSLRPRSVEEKGAIARELEDYVWPIMEIGVIRPIIYRTFPLAEAAAAHALLESGEHIGKIVLTVE
ncbi:MAG: NAD(P)H-quinone oxidoreductase [Capsulimonadaceae bacterium]